MSFRDSQTAKVGTGGSANYLILDDKRSMKPGTFYFVLGAGEVPANAPKGTMVDYSSVIENKQVTFFDKAQIYFHDMGEKGKFFQWHFTYQENDPIIELGLGRIGKNGLASNVGNESGKTSGGYSDPERIKEVYGPYGTMQKFLRRQVHIPVLEVDENGENEKAAILIVNENQAKKIFDSGSILAKSKNKNLKGQIIRLIKNTADGVAPADQYKWTLQPGDNLLTPEMQETFDKLVAEDFEKLETIYREVNGGEMNPENVWNYLLNFSGLTKAQFMKKYCVKPNISIDPNPVDTINFDEPADA